MTVQRTDVRFMLPRPPRTVALLGSAGASRSAFEDVGGEVVDGGTAADLVLAPATHPREALAAAGAAVVLEGAPSAAALRRHGLSVRDLLPLPGVERPALVLPLDQPRAMRGALRHLGGPKNRVKALRNRVTPALLGRWIAPGRARLTVGVREPGPPFLLAAAREAGAEGGNEFFWTTGASDILSRGVLHLFRADRSEPECVVKFGRVPGYVDAFERDAKGLGLAAAAGGSVAAHAPTLLARLEVEGLPASVESAAPGEQLIAHLGSTARRGAKLAAIDRVAGWIVAIARETATGPPALEPELARIRRDVLPLWREVGAGEELLAHVDRAPAVFQHNDLGTWNVMVDGDRFTAVDWESARPAGLPLWDLIYFLAYAILGVDRVPAERQERHLVEVFLGRSRSSALMFGWIRRAASELGLPEEAIGRLATTCWLHHGLSHVARDQAVRAAGAAPADDLTSLPRRLARRWLTEPGLGARWSAWRD